MIYYINFLSIFMSFGDDISSCVGSLSAFRQKKGQKKNLYPWMFCKFLCVYYHLLAHHVSKLLYKINSNIKVKKKDETFEINFCLMSNRGLHFLTRKNHVIFFMKLWWLLCLIYGWISWTHPKFKENIFWKRKYRHNANFLMV